MRDKKFLSQYVITSLTNVPALRLAMQELLNCTRDGLYKMIKRKAEILVSVNAINLISAHLNLTQEEILSDLE